MPYACNVIKKETLAQVFSTQFCKISKNTFSYRTSSVAASGRFVLGIPFLLLEVSLFPLSEGRFLLETILLLVEVILFNGILFHEKKNFCANDFILINLIFRGTR